jgi:hypothetical protein
MLLSPRRMTSLETAIKKRGNTLFDACKFEITPKDFVELYINPDHIPILNTTREICGDIGTQWAIESRCETNVAAVPQVRISISFGGKSPIIIPQYVSKGWQAGEHPLKDQIIEWLNDRITKGILFAQATEAITYLNAICSDFRAFRALFPAISILINDCAGDDPRDPMRKLAARVHKNQDIKSMPRISREAKLKLLEISELITATTLLDGSTDTSNGLVTSEKVWVSLSSNSYRCDSPFRGNAATYYI